MNLYRNKKNGQLYITLYEDVIDKSDGAGIMASVFVYKKYNTETSCIYARDSVEFLEKFEAVVVA